MLAIVVLASLPGISSLAAGPKDAKVQASWTVETVDSFSDTEDIVTPAPKYNDTELGVVSFVYRADNPEDVKFLAAVRLALYNRHGKKTEAEIPLADTKHIPESAQLEFIGLYKGGFYITRAYDFTESQTVGDTTTTREIHVVNIYMVNMKTKSIGTDNAATLTDSLKETTTVGGEVISITGRSEDLRKVVILPGGVFVSGTTRLYKDSKLDAGFIWGRIYDLKLVVIKTVMPDQAAPDNGSVEYLADIISSRHIVLEKKTVLSETQRSYEVTIFK